MSGTKDPPQRSEQKSGTASGIREHLQKREITSGRYVHRQHFLLASNLKKKKESAQLEKEARVRKNLKQWLCLDAEINWPSPRLTYQIDVYPGGSNVLLFTCGLQRCITCVRERPRPLSCKLSKSVSNASFTRRYFKLRTELSVSCTAGACLSPPLQRIRSRHDTVSRGDVH